MPTQIGLTDPQFPYISPSLPGIKSECRFCKSFQALLGVTHLDPPLISRSISKIKIKKWSVGRGKYMSLSSEFGLFFCQPGTMSDWTRPFKCQLHSQTAWETYSETLSHLSTLLIKPGQADIEDKSMSTSVKKPLMTKSGHLQAQNKSSQSISASRIKLMSRNSFLLQTNTNTSI